MKHWPLGYAVALVFCIAGSLPGEEGAGRLDPHQPNAGAEAVSAAAGRAASSDDFTIHVRVAEVMVPFTVTDGKRAVADVSLQEVSVTDDAAPAESIVYFGRLRALPLRLGLLIDSSDSIIQRSYFEEQAASRFVHQVVKPETDRAFVVEFTTGRPVQQEETSDLRKLDAAIAALDPLGRTPLYDAVYQACQKLAESRDPNRVARVLVLISDGEDNSSKVSLDQVINTAQNAEIMVFAISTKGSRPVFGRKSRGDSALMRLAEETGGRALFADRSDDLKRAFSAVEQEIRNRYVLFYRPPDLQENGRYHGIQVLVRRAGKQLRVYARKGYRARMEAPSD